jgi:hypothetical protein
MEEFRELLTAMQTVTSAEGFMNLLRQAIDVYQTRDLFGEAQDLYPNFANVHFKIHTVEDLQEIRQLLLGIHLYNAEPWRAFDNYGEVIDEWKGLMVDLESSITPRARIAVLLDLFYVKNEIRMFEYVLDETYDEETSPLPVEDSPENGFQANELMIEFRRYARLLAHALMSPTVPMMTRKLLFPNMAPIFLHRMAKDFMILCLNTDVLPRELQIEAFNAMYDTPLLWDITVKPEVINRIVDGEYEYVKAMCRALNSSLNGDECVAMLNKRLYRFGGLRQDFELLAELDSGERNLMIAHTAMAVFLPQLMELPDETISKVLDHTTGDSESTRVVGMLLLLGHIYSYFVNQLPPGTSRDAPPGITLNTQLADTALRYIYESYGSLDAGLYYVQLHKIRRLFRDNLVIRDVLGDLSGDVDIFNLQVITEERQTREALALLTVRAFRNNEGHNIPYHVRRML